MAYIGQPQDKGCIFCDFYRKRHDGKNLVVMRSRYCFAVFNRFPYSNGHIMVVANRHVKTLEQLRDEELLDTMKVLIKIQSALKKILRPDGFNIGINLGRFAGAGIEKHIHIHIVPRWAGDTNFMPVLANTKIISQSLQDIYRLTKRELGRRPPAGQ